MTLVDGDRYDQLENVADAVGLSRGRNDLWRDRAMVILTEAVMHSFAQAGVAGPAASPVSQRRRSSVRAYLVVVLAR